MDLTFYKKIKYPLCFLFNLVNYLKKYKYIPNKINNNNYDISKSIIYDIVNKITNTEVKQTEITDELLFYTIKYFLRIFHPKIANYNILKLFYSLKNKYNKTFILIKSHQKLIKINTNNFNKYLEYQKKTNKINKYICKMTLEKQINYWKNKLKILNSINDSTYGDGFFIKIIMDTNNKFYDQELFNRFILIKNTFGIKFFKHNNISLFTVYDYHTFDDNTKKHIYMLLFKNIKQILTNDIQFLINTLEHWNLIKHIYS